MTAIINYSQDGKRYFIAREGCESKFWFSVATRPGHIDQRLQTKAFNDGKLWINVTTRDGRVYRRAIHAYGDSTVGKSKPISENHIMFKDYALFHQWPQSGSGRVETPTN